MRFTDEFYGKFSNVLSVPEKNAEFRKELLTRCAGDRSAQDDVVCMCARDPLFYINAFGFLYEPRDSSILPFVTYPFQNEALCEMVSVLGEDDLLIEKSRDMGASWMGCVSLEWAWHFYPHMSFLMVSRKEELVDKQGDPKSLFWKLDYVHKHLPLWLRPNTYRKKLHLLNRDNGSTIDGESTTGEVARGDRRTAILLDEFAFVENGYSVLSATRDATKCRLFNSTPNGLGNAFADIANEGVTKKLTLHWTRHPLKSRGLYHDADGKPRSPWYDKEVARCANLQEVKQELDIDYAGSDYNFFDVGLLEKLQREQCKPPVFKADINYDSATLSPSGLIEVINGPLSMWRNMAEGERPPDDREYVIGVDIAMGGISGASKTSVSESAASISDTKTGEKIAEYVVKDVSPIEFANRVIALAKFFAGKSGGAYVIWEGNGPGLIFTSHVLGLGYRNIYYRRNEQSVSKTQSDAPGWWTTRDSKRMLLGLYREALANRDFRNPSYESLQQAKAYISKGAAVVHSKAEASQNPNEGQDNHGDRVIADALCWFAMRERVKKAEEKEAAQVIPYGSLAWRREQAKPKDMELAWIL